MPSAGRHPERLRGPGADGAAPASIASPMLEALPRTDRFLNRELSWLEFNARVLALAEDQAQRLLERAKFLAIFGSNLDEFFQVRVAGLQEQRTPGSVRSPRGH